MKKQTTNQFSQISKEQTEKLTTVVKETLAFGFSQVKHSAQLICGIFNAGAGQCYKEEALFKPYKSIASFY